MNTAATTMSLTEDGQPMGVNIANKLPLIPAEITAEWFSEKLNLPVKSINQTDVIWGTASKIFYTLTYENDERATARPTQVCVKGGFIPELTKQLPPLINFYRVEAKFFNILAPKLHDMQLPKCWWAGDNSEQGIIILDNLAVKNYTFGEPVEPWTVSRVKDGVEQLAALHAGGWGATRAEYPWTTKYADTILGILDAINYHEFVCDSARFQLPKPFQDAARVRAMLTKYFSSYNPKFRCMVHGDAHVGNTSITPEGKVSFIDWQLLDCGSCFHDVSYFIGAALTISDRRTHEMEILDHYLDALARFGGPQFSRTDEDLMVEYKKSFLVGMGWAVTNTTMQPIERINALLERFTAAYLDHTVMEIVEALPEATLE